MGGSPQGRRGGRGSDTGGSRCCGQNAGLLPSNSCPSTHKNGPNHLGNWVFNADCPPTTNGPPRKLGFIVLLSVCVCVFTQKGLITTFFICFFLRIKPIRRRERADGGGHVERSPQDDEEGSRPGDSPRKQIWTVIKRDGPNHLGFWLIRQIWTSSSMMALITPSWSI